MNYTKKPKKIAFPLETFPELTDLLTDLAIFTQKWQTPKIANTADVSKQALQYHINKKKKESK